MRSKIENNSTRFQQIAFGFVALSLVGAAASAHEGHGHVAATEYDLSAPRRLSAEARRHIGLDVAAASVRTIEDVMWVSGEVRELPEARTIAAARSAGIVLEVTKRLGDRVAAGELLARIDSPERARAIYDLRKVEVEIADVKLEIETVGGSIRTEEAARSAAVARRDTARLALERGMELGESTLSRTEIETRRTAVAEAEAALVASDAALTALNGRERGLRNKLAAVEVSREALAALFNLDVAPEQGVQPSAILELRAPRAGTVTEVAAVAGEWVAAGSALFEIIELSRMLVEARVPERELARSEIGVGAAARVWLDRTAIAKGPLATGTVRFIAAEIDAAVRTGSIGIEVESPAERLRIGQFVEVALVRGARDRVLAVPREAVIEFGSLAFVFVETGDELIKQDVAIGVRDDRFTEVLSGLAPNDRVVVRGGFALTQMQPAEKTATDHAADGHDTPEHGY